MQDETNFITKEQYKRFIESIPKMKMFNNPFTYPKFDKNQVTLLFKVIYEGALRVSEAINLTCDDILKEDKMLKLENTKGNKKRGKIKYTSDGQQVHKKTAQREYATVTTETFEKLMLYCEFHNGKLFPVSRQTVWKWIKEIGEIAGITLQHNNKTTTNMTIHTLRHARAIHYLDAGKPINVVQKKLRHSSLQPTSTYTNININKLKEMEDDI